jgi:WD40 repeat protein
MAAEKAVTLTLLSDLTPPSLERTWLTSPHPTLPLVATCSSDKTVRVYSLTNFRLLSTISGGHKRSVRTCAWKPNISGESVLATGSFDATVGIWRRWDNYEETARQRQQRDGVQDEDRIEAEEGEEEDEEEWRFAVLLDGHDSEVKSVSWSASGALLATCSRDKSIWVWEDLDDGDNNFETVAVMQEHEGDVKCVAWHPTEECLASGSYDDTVRIWREDIDDWGQVACIRGHGGTVWGVDWEATENVPSFPGALSAQVESWNQWHAPAGPRLATCSHDRTVRVWRRQPKAPASALGASGIPSIIRPSGTDETWEEDAILPAAHVLSIYAIAWSRRTGLLASVGADGRIVVYEERFVSQTSEPMETDSPTPAEVEATAPHPPTEWRIITIVDGAHGIYEINHVAWAKRADRGRDESRDEEVLVTTADDGSIKVWNITR